MSLSVNGSNQFNTPGFTYDAAGNLTRDPLHTYQWDAEGRVVSVDGVGGQACQATWTACYVYDAEGQRVEKQTGATYNEYVYDGYGGVAFVTDRLSWVDAEIPSWGSRPLARYYTGNTDFPHRDALGSSIYVTQHPGWTAQKLTFYPWGQLWQNTWVRDERFASLQRRDAESGLDPTAFRMYSSNQARWLSPDPLAGDVTNPQSLNRYAYVLNNPTSLIDPLGLGDENCTWNGASSTLTCPTPPSQGSQLVQSAWMLCKWIGKCSQVEFGGSGAGGPRGGGKGAGGSNATMGQIKDALLNNPAMDLLANNADYLPGVCAAGVFGFATGGVGNKSGGGEAGFLWDKEIGSPSTVQGLAEASYGPVGVGGTSSEALVFVQPAPTTPAGVVFAADWHNSFINNKGISIGLWGGKLGHGKLGSVPVAGGIGGGGYLTFSSAANCLEKR